MKPIIICFTCRKRVAEQDIRSGLHDHVDVQERLRLLQHAQLTRRE